MKIASPAFEQQGRIPKKHTGEGENLSPPLEISEIPAGTTALALIVDDPDAPRGTFDHWIAWNIPPQTQRLPEGAAGAIEMREGRNGFDKEGYSGPYPPRGPAHRYFFKLYALDTPLSLLSGSGKREVEEAMEGHILATCQLIGTYQRT